MQFKKRNKMSADKMVSKPFTGSEKMVPKPMMGSDKPMIKGMASANSPAGELSVKANLTSLKKKSDMPTVKTMTAMELEEESPKEKYEISEASEEYKNRIKKRMK